MSIVYKGFLHYNKILEVANWQRQKVSSGVVLRSFQPVAGEPCCFGSETSQHCEVLTSQATEQREHTLKAGLAPSDVRMSSEGLYLAGSITRSHHPGDQGYGLWGLQDPNCNNFGYVKFFLEND